MCEARNFAACMDEIYGVRREICSVRLEDRFLATRRSKICCAKYGVEFHSAAHGDEIYGAMADKKGFGTGLASVRNFGLKNARVNLRPRNTYTDLKFKGSANSKPVGGINFKFKNGASFGFLCGGNAKSLKSRTLANALNSSGANKILASIWAGRILSSGISAMDLVFDAVAKNFISSSAARILSSSSAARILSSSAEAGILASSLANKILNPSAAGEISKPNAAGKILSLSAVPSTGADFGLKGAGRCGI